MGESRATQTKSRPSRANQSSRVSSHDLPAESSPGWQRRKDSTNHYLERYITIVETYSLTNNYGISTNPTRKKFDLSISFHEPN